MVLAPLSGVLVIIICYFEVGKFLADAFCAPNARYAPKLLMLLGAF